MSEQSDAHPFVHWGQNETHVFLSIRLGDAQDVRVDIEDEVLHFEGLGTGAHGRRAYKFSLAYYLPVIAKDRHNAEMKELENEEMWEAFLKILKHPLTIYLLLFNLFQFAGFLCVWGTLILHWLQPNSPEYSNWYEFVVPRLVLVQLVQLFEPLHAILGWVRTNPLTSLVQVLGRCFGMFFIVLPHPDFRSSTTVFWLFFAWSSIEIVRYPHYTVSLLGFESGLLTYLRYTLWIPLYPIGFICEAFYKLMRHMYLQRRRVIGPRPRVGSDQMGFFSFVPMLRSLIYGKKAALDGPVLSRPSRSRRTLPSSNIGVPLSKLQ
ncbi:unnamed protein product [Echinostoma caproni]|uniref:Very-long-chain (3R)-3-hydroxyacyl-CoA dehydratase n=1 Tax=Echinostoma caproni TaxID=27848 RepID=A0A183AXE1_9TREM|nr:unnamed protein product [Echinostoma caproni]